MPFLTRPSGPERPPHPIRKWGFGGPLAGLNHYFAGEIDHLLRCAGPRSTQNSRNVNVDLGIWQKLSRLMAGLIFAAAALAVVVWYIPLFQQNERMRKEIQQLQGQIRREDQVSKRLENSIKSLRDDPKTVERMAREKLGYAKTGETVIYFEQKTTNIVTQSR